jgi:putative peptidoglycan binding protein
MSARHMLSTVGTAVGGVLGWSAEPPPADPGTLRDLFADLGVRPGPAAADLDATVRAFQAWVGLTHDGVAGPRTVHALVRYAREARHLREIAP